VVALLRPGDALINSLSIKLGHSQASIEDLDLLFGSYRKYSEYGADILTS
jgi:hypothetical protein